MGFTITGTILGKDEFYSKKKEQQVYQLNMYDGNKSIVQVLNVPADVYAAASVGEVVSLRVSIAVYGNNGQPKLLVSFKELVA